MDFLEMADVSLVLYFFTTTDLIITPLYCCTSTDFITPDFRVSRRYEYVNYVFLSLLL